MKKYKVLLVIIVTAIISVFSTVLADSILNSDKVTYKDTTLDRSLDNVYSNLNTITGINSFGTATYATSQGTPLLRRELTKEITKGKYIVITANSEAWDDPGTYPAENEVSSQFRLSCQSGNCDIRKIGGYHNQPKATDPIVTYYRMMITGTAVVYYIDVKEDMDTISVYAEAARTYSEGAQALTFHVIPIE